MADPYAAFATPVNSGASDPYASIATPFDPQTAVSTTGDAVKSFGSGVVKGVSGLIGLPRTIAELGYMGADKIAEKLGVQDRAPVGDTFSALPSAQGTQAAIEQVTGPLYRPQTRVGEYAQTAGEMLPNAAIPGGMVNRAANVLVPAVVSETAGQLTKGKAAEPYARAAGAMLGGVAAPRVASPLPATAEHARRVAVLDAEGVGQHLTAGERTGSQALKYLEDATATIPGAAGPITAARTASGEALTRAALQRVGENAPRATPQVIDQAFRRIGGEFDRLAANNTLRADPQMAQDLRRVILDYQDLVPAFAQSPIANMTTQIAQRIAQNNNTLPGEVYQTFRSRLDRAARSSRNDPQLSDALMGIRNALDDAMGRSMSAADQAAWGEARNQYRNLMVIEKAASSAGTVGKEGVLTPETFAQAAKGQNVRQYARGQGDFSELAQAARSTMQALPNSGTAQRAQAQSLLAAAGAGMGLTAAGPVGAAGGMMAPYLMQVGAGRALMSRPVQNWLSNQGAAGGQGVPIWAGIPQAEQATGNPLFDTRAR